jgi:tetratricopeptide (TPR) repeat protein
MDLITLEPVRVNSGSVTEKLVQERIADDPSVLGLGDLAAHYSAGDWKAAIEALKKSMELRKGGDSFDWFFLAMAHWQLGEKEQARKWYDQAVQWMQKHAPQDADLKHFRAEAATLLGVADQKK